MITLFHVAVIAAVNLWLVLRYPVEAYRTLRSKRGLPNIALPDHMAERLLWRRLIDHNPQFPVWADKLRGKEFVQSRVPDISVPETLWVEADPDAAAARGTDPETVIKANHGCDMNFFPKGDEDAATCAAMYRDWLAVDYSAVRKEWCYRDIPRRIFAERRIKAGRLIDVNVRCADGKALLTSIIQNNKTDAMRYSYYLPDGREFGFFGKDATGKLALHKMGPIEDVLGRPALYARIIDAAERISRGIDYGRFDFMTDGTEVYGGEITLYPSAGYVPPIPPGVPNHNLITAGGWDLRKSWFVSTPAPGWRGLYARAMRHLLDRRAERRSRDQRPASTRP